METETTRIPVMDAAEATKHRMPRQDSHTVSNGTGSSSFRPCRADIEEHPMKTVDHRPDATDREVWNVVITLDDAGDRITALARLHDGPDAAIGLGSATRDELADLESKYTIAARRSLEDLGRSLGYLADVRGYAAADQA
jgi:hypothetical protein